MAKDLIQKAREFAALADKATPGPWAWVNWSARPHVCPGVIGDRLGVSVSAHRTRADREDADGMLIAAAPEMAKLLAEMADEQERTRKVLGRLANAADPFLADQSRATDERVALVQPVTVKEAEELNAACREAWEVLDETSNI